MAGAVIGAAATALAALLALFGMLRSGRAPEHLADITGLTALVDELQEELGRRSRELAACYAECARLRKDPRA